MSREPFMPLTSLTVVGDTETRVPKCGQCRLFAQCHSPKMPAGGKGKRKILIVGEFPGDHEDAKGVHFVGPQGRRLEHELHKVGIDMREDCWLDSSLACHPKHNKIPNDKMIGWCRPHVIANIERLKPEVILLVGGKAVDSVIGWLWQQAPDGIHRWAGYQIPNQKLNAWVCSTFHPSYLAREESKVLDGMFAKHLKGVSELRGRPHKKVPDYLSKVRVELDPIRAAELVYKMVSPTLVTGGRPVIAFDYETTCLKPDGQHAKIVSCSVSDGITSIAFPWRGQVVHLMQKVLRSEKILKIASNAKFEDRWTMKEFGFPVAGWVWDTMLMAHGLENASKPRKITSIKFQAFVHLGVQPWDRRVKPYLESEDDGGNSPNKIRKLDITTLLTYNALDSLYEFLVAKVQKAKFLEGRDG